MYFYIVCKYACRAATIYMTYNVPYMGGHTKHHRSLLKGYTMQKHAVDLPGLLDIALLNKNNNFFKHLYSFWV